jgi:hypothetical protein
VNISTFFFLSNILFTSCYFMCTCLVLEISLFGSIVVKHRSNPLIFPTTYNGIRTKNHPVWITPCAAPIRWMGPIRNPCWEQMRTAGYVIVSNRHIIINYIGINIIPARVTNRSHSTYGSSARSDSHRAVFCPNSVGSGWKN